MLVLVLKTSGIDDWASGGQLLPDFSHVFPWVTWATSHCWHPRRPRRWAFPHTLRKVFSDTRDLETSTSSPCGKRPQAYEGFLFTSSVYWTSVLYPKPSPSPKGRAPRAGPGVASTGTATGALLASPGSLLGGSGFGMFSLGNYAFA